MVRIHSFAWVCSVFPAPLSKGTVLSPLHILGSLVIKYWTVEVWVYFWALSSVLLICVSALMPVCQQSVELCHRV